MTNAPVFVVGVPRSGTTLLAAMLAANSKLSCGPETHFFRRLSRVDVEELCAREFWPDKAVRFICSITHTNFSTPERKPLLEKYEIDETSISSYLSAREPSVANILASVTCQYMLRMKKNRWVEKTPDHIAHLQSVRKHFPDSPVIRIVRDPRDVALSLKKVPWGAQGFLEALVHWKKLQDLSREFFAGDLLCYTLRFEDLIASPREQLQQLCGFLLEEFEESMLDTSTTGKQINSRNVAWKEKVSQPVDSSRVAVWRNELSRQENQLAEAVLGDELEANGYPREEHFGELGELYPTPELAARYVGALESLASSGVRFWKTHKNEKPSAQIYLGNPSNSSWLGQKKTKRALSTFLISTKILKTAVSKCRVYWVPDPSEKMPSGYFGGWLKRLLTPYKLSTAD